MLDFHARSNIEAMASVAPYLGLGAPSEDLVVFVVGKRFLLDVVGLKLH